MQMKIWLFTPLCLVSVFVASASEMSEEGFADSSGVKIHYVTIGEGRWS